MARTEATITGSVDLDVDEQGAKAVLTIIRDTDGRPWSTNEIASLLKQKNIVGGIDIDTVRRRLETMVARKEPKAVIVIAEGLAPADGEAEHAGFGDIALPVELTDDADRVVQAAENPEIIFNRTRKIQKQQIRLKKAALPFLPAKEERVMVTETELVPERIYVDPTVEQVGWVTEEARVGRVSPQKTGAPGRNIFGAIVHPKSLPDPRFYCGTGLRRQGEELVATTTGFLRIGSNWADVVPYRPHSWEVELSGDKASCFLVFAPGHPEASLPPTDDVIARAIDLGFTADQLISAKEVARSVSDTVERRNADRIPLTGSRDSSCDIIISEDRLKAVLNIGKGKGRGKPLVLKEVGHAIRAQGLARLDQKRIQEDILAFYRSTETDLIGYVLAEGNPPGEAPDREPEFSIRPLPETQQREMVRRIAEDPRASEGIKSLFEFPMERVSTIALVDREQRIVTVPPAVDGPAGTDVFGKAIKCEAQPDPPLKLFENLSKTGTVIISQIDGALDRGEVDGSVFLRVRPHADADITVTVTQDRTKAFLSLADGAGTGRRIDEQTVLDALERANVRFGIKQEVVNAAVRTAMDGERVTNLAVAEAAMPDRPADKTFELLVNPIGQRSVKIKEDGTADYKNPDNIRTVTAGTKLARILPRPTEGRPGTDVTGATIPASTTSRPEPEAGTFVRTEELPDGGVLLVADREGEFVFEANKLEIRVEHTIAGNVDLSTGNIRFPGSVTITGTVTGGFFVVSGGNVNIGEAVEAGLISAEGNILVRQGIKGSGKGVLRAKGAIGAGFAEQSVLLSVGDITINAGALHCTIKTNGKVVVQKDKGGVVGGAVRARLGLSTPNLGSANGARTSVSFGQDYLIADQIEKEEKEIEQIKRRVTAADLSMRREGLTPEQVEALRQEKKRLLKGMEKRSLRLFTLRERFEQHHESTVTVRGTVHPGVTLESHGRKLDIASPRKAVAFIFDQKTGHIIEKPIEKSDG